MDLIANMFPKPMGKKYPLGIAFGALWVIGAFLLLEGPPLGASLFYSADWRKLKGAGVNDDHGEGSKD